jgi:hypothetical protein
MRITGTLAMFLMALTASAGTATFEWNGAIQAGQTLEIRNVIGDIKAETVPGPDAEISVRIAGTHPDPSTIRIDVVPHDGGILVCTIYQGLSYPDHCSPDQTPSLSLTNTDLRVTYTVRVPENVVFVPRTINGNISADLAGSPVSANTVNGRILLSTSRPAAAQVVNGSILASLGNVEWIRRQAFTAVNGSIDIELPGDCHATVRADTVWGHITNDFNLPVHKTIVASWLSGDINGGGASLVLATVNGSMHLRRTPAQ